MVVFLMELVLVDSVILEFLGDAHRVTVIDDFEVMRLVFTMAVECSAG